MPYQGEWVRAAEKKSIVVRKHTVVSCRVPPFAADPGYFSAPRGPLLSLSAALVASFTLITPPQKPVSLLGKHHLLHHCPSLTGEKSYVETNHSFFTIIFFLNQEDFLSILFILLIKY